MRDFSDSWEKVITRTARFLLAAAALFLAAILLGFAVAAGWTQAVDLRISADLVLHVGTSDPAVIAFMQGVSWIGGGTPRWGIVILLCALVWHWCGPRSAAALGAASLLANFASTLLKMAFDRPRPDLVPALDHVTSAAYPSGHATSAAVVYLLLAWLAPPRWRAAAWTLAAAIIILNAFSRVMLGVHWPSDIVGGTLLGTAFALIAAAWAGAHDKPPAATLTES